MTAPSFMDGAAFVRALTKAAFRKTSPYRMIMKTSQIRDMIAEDLALCIKNCMLFQKLYDSVRYAPCINGLFG